MINKNEIIKAVAERHQVFINQDDPILGVFAINDVILEDGAKSTAAIMQKQSEQFISNLEFMLERQQGWIKQENESSFRYHGQIIRDAHTQFERSLDDTISTIRKWHLETVELKTSAWMAAMVTIVITVLGCCAAVAMNIGR